MGAIKNFFTVPKTMNGSIGVWSTKEAGAKNVMDLFPNLAHNTVDATIGTVSEYVKDIITPGWDGIKSFGNMFNPKAIADNGGFLKNTVKSFSGGVTREVTAVKNMIGGVVWGIGKVYQRGVQDNIHDFSASTIDNLPYIWWPGLWNTVKAIATIPALVGKAPSFIVSQIDKGFDTANQYTARNGRDIPKTVLRV